MDNYRKYNAYRHRRRLNRLAAELFCLGAALLVISLLAYATFSSPTEADSAPVSRPRASGTRKLSSSRAALTARADNSQNTWNLILVNAQNPLPEDFQLELTRLKNGHSIDSRVYPALQEMMDAARAEGLSPLICSSYRTYEKQQALFDTKVNVYLSAGFPRAAAESEAARWVAVPGTSEHESGLAVDIVSEQYQILDDAQADTPEQQWLMANAHLYGFILRYPESKESITGISYEPWHYRYVGREAAFLIRENCWCLEEYLERLEE